MQPWRACGHLRTVFFSTLICAVSAGTASGADVGPRPTLQQVAAAANAVNLAQQSASAIAPPDPIALRDISLVYRDLENLARRHGLVPPPPPPATTRAQMSRIFWDIVRALGQLPPDQITSEDYVDIGRLTKDFEEVVQEVQGKLTMALVRNELAPVFPAAASAEKGKEFDQRLKLLEAVKVSGDFTFLPQSDMGRGVRDSTAANMRGRINFLTKVNEAKPNSTFGDAQLFLRLTAASGRFFPRNKYLMSPINDLNDYAANPFNTGVNEVQVQSLQINNNNSNNVRPTVSLEQAWYAQDLQFKKNWKGAYRVGLNNFSNYFDANNFANNETLQFLNSQFVNNVSWRPNFIGPSTIFNLEHSMFRNQAFLRATTGIISLSDRDYFGGYGTNHELQFGQKFFGKEGNLRAGFWLFNFRAGSSKPYVTPVDLSPSGLLSILPGGTPTASRPAGLYCNFDQKIWKDIGIWGRYGLNDKQLGEVFLGGLLSSRFAYSFGAEIPVKIFTKRRSDDVIGIAFGGIGAYRRGAITPATPAFVSLNGVPATTIDQVNANLAVMDPGKRPATEKCLETYYRCQLNKNVSVGPDMQVIWSPGATAPQPAVFVLGSRLNVTF